MIPSKIHFCWFGSNNFSPTAIACIESWKKFLPGYEIIQWNEQNYDIRKIPYIAQAYDAKKYAFVSDYARFDILYNHGGIYFDTDVELLKDISEIIQQGNWCALETAGLINPGLGIATEPGNNIIKLMLESYKNSSFSKENKYNHLTVVDRFSNIMKKYGLSNKDETQHISGFNVYASEYFCPKNVETGRVNVTKKTAAIHHYEASWIEDWQKEFQTFKHSFLQRRKNNLLSQCTVNAVHFLFAIKNLGFSEGMEYCIRKYKKGLYQNAELPSRKILFVSNTANFSKFNKPYMEWCSSNNWKVDYCSTNDEPIYGIDSYINIDIPRFPFSRQTFTSIKKLHNHLKQTHYSIVHCHTPMGGAITRLAARKLHKNKHIKIIYTAHGFHFFKGAPLLNWLVYFPVEKFLARYTDTIITINKEDFNLAKKHFSKYADIKYMNGVGINLNRFHKVSTSEKSEIRKKLNLSENEFIITVVAELNKNKNQIFLIKNLKNLKKQIPELKVLFLGKGTCPKIRKTFQKHKCDSFCSFLGYRRDVDLFQKAGDICFSASKREGLPVNIMEGMACGKVCIVSSNRGHNSLIQDNQNGLIFRLNNSQEMIEKIVSVYKDKNLYKRLAEKASQDSVQYDEKLAVKFMSDLYTSLIENKGMKK